MKQRSGAVRVNLENLLQESDFVTLHVPLTPQATHLINKDKLRLMKRTAYLINNSRGAVVDEKALYETLKSGRIAGATLDVYEQEPIASNSPLLELSNVVVAPHISSASIETRAKMSEMVPENPLSYFRGEKPLNLVNVEILKRRRLDVKRLGKRLGRFAIVMIFCFLFLP